MSNAYSDWSLEKLRKERQKIDKAIANAEKRGRKETLAKVSAIARQNGFELHELVSDLPATQKRREQSIAISKPRQSRGKVAPKYRNPDDESQMWTGRGRQPLWVKELLANGVLLEDLAIKVKT